MPNEPLLSQIAIVGGGPSGFYAAEALLRKIPKVTVDMFDRLPTPFGLVRGGVAPDHPKIKQVCLVYEKIARSPGFAFWGNVEIGNTLTVDELLWAYHAVVLAYGASAERSLDIPGEDLQRSHSASEFVGWYNGHPDYHDRRFDFSGQSAVIIGQGNVAADLARMLATPPDELLRTDITEQALHALFESNIRDIHIVGRRGAAQARFTSAELKELGQVRDCVAVVNPEDLKLEGASAAEIADPRADEAKKNFETFCLFSRARSSGAKKRILFHFRKSPIRFNGQDKVESITLAENELKGPPFAQVAVATPRTFDLPCDLAFRSIGYRGVAVAGLSIDKQSGTIPNTKGRCLLDGHPLPGLYVTGWIKRGATGVIGTNRADSVETVNSIVEDLSKLEPTLKTGIAGIRNMLMERGARIVTYVGWEKIDAIERARGQTRGKPREKFTVVSDMIAAIEKTSS